jgi:hypothetical protein
MLSAEMVTLLFTRLTLLFTFMSNNPYIVKNKSCIFLYFLTALKEFLLNRVKMRLPSVQTEQENGRLGQTENAPTTIEDDSEF